MAVPGLFTDRAELESLLSELAAELATRGVEAEIVMVGGSWMLWHSQRAATRDVDSARRFDAGLAAVIDAIGTRHDLQRGWLNDAAASFWPAGMSYDACEVVLQQDGLVVRTPPADVIFTMKLYRSDPQDREDMILLWPMCSFRTPREAVDAYWAAYPHAPEDEYLEDHVAAIASEA